mmetsp:Transcript_16827/g.41397  ORF Transcript_16827/g.41397 Transcript_16827/m.41397 type:complete len:94 (+) Transcript_16827:525-806(+)
MLCCRSSGILEDLLRAQGHRRQMLDVLLLAGCDFNLSIASKQSWMLDAQKPEGGGVSCLVASTHTYQGSALLPRFSPASGRWGAGRAVRWICE